MIDDDKFMEKLNILKEEPPAELLDRILTVVPHMAQVSPRAEGIPLLRFFGEFRYALAVKFAAVGVIAVMGFCVGHLKGPASHQDGIIMESVLTGEAGMEDEYAMRIF